MPTRIDREKCNNCGVCLFQCGADVYEGRWMPEGFTVVAARTRDCVDCLLCVERCPEKAIEIFVSGARYALSGTELSDASDHR